MEEESGHVATAGVSIQKEEIAEPELEACQSKRSNSELLLLRSLPWLPGSITQQKKIMTPTTTRWIPKGEELLVNQY